MSGSNHCFLPCIQVSQEAGKVVWYSHLLKNLPQFVVSHTVKGFSVVNEAEVNICLELSCFFCDPMDVGNLISGSSAFSRSNLYIWKLSLHVLLKPSLKDFENYLTSMWNESHCVVIWTFFSIALIWDWNENWPFPVLIKDLRMKSELPMASLPSASSWVSSALTHSTLRPSHYWSSWALCCLQFFYMFSLYLVIFPCPFIRLLLVILQVSV